MTGDYMFSTRWWTMTEDRISVNNDKRLANDDRGCSPVGSGQLGTERQMKDQ